MLDIMKDSLCAADEFPRGEWGVAVKEHGEGAERAGEGEQLWRWSKGVAGEGEFEWIIGFQGFKETGLLKVGSGTE